jgi:hypothetical protein
VLPQPLGASLERVKICLSCEGVSDTPAARCGHCGSWLLPTEAVHYPIRRGEVDAGNPLLGTVVDGKYRLQSVLGRGGLGTVFRAQHIGSLMPVALKLLHPRFAERPEYRRALLPEARRAATVTHERCARLLDVGEAEQGTAYLAMELVAGDTLDVVLQHGPLAPSHAVEVLVQIAEALVAIHGSGLVHCDLSPRNVVLSHRDGTLRVKVLDFGIARSATVAGAVDVRADFAGFANPAFAAPELLAGRDVDPRADLYSFGTLAWWLLTGTMPVDDTEARTAAAAVIAGELRPWPATPGVPRRLLRLVRQCLAIEPARRPSNAAVLVRELLLVRGARRPALARLALLAAVAAVLLRIAADAGGPAPFLRAWSGSELSLQEGPLHAAQPTQYLRSARLGSLGFHFGGFLPRQLRIDLARGGSEPAHVPLRPEFDAAAGTLVLSTTQPSWVDLVANLARISRDGPVDLVFVVPGAAPLGAARVLLDDEPPLVEAVLEESADGMLVAASTLRWSAVDAGGVASAVAVLSLQDGRRLELPLEPSGGTFALGSALATVLGDVMPQGPGELVLRAVDRAGNERELAPLGFVVADVAAPAVQDVTGPNGEPFAPVLGGRAALRVRLGQAEPGATVTIRLGDAAATTVMLGVIPVVAADLVAPVPLAPSSLVHITVQDAAGNVTTSERRLELRDRTVAPMFLPVAGSVRWLGGELVVTEAGAVVAADFGTAWRLGEVTVEGQPRALDGGLRLLAQQLPQLHLGRLPPGEHVLRLELIEAAADSPLRTQYPVRLRVLPPPLEVRVPRSTARFLPELVQAGVLARRPLGVGEGHGWRLPAGMRPYLRGMVWSGASTPVPLALAASAGSGDPLLPDIGLVPGRNVLAVELRDVLDRPVRVADTDHGDTLAVIADFWWHEGAPESIGEELPVEHGRPAQVRLRLPLPFQPGDIDRLRLGIAQDEVLAAAVQPTGDGASVVRWEVPFSLWSVGAQLAERSREEFAGQLQRQLEVYVATPAGRHSLALRLRTVRTTLAPVALAELAEPGRLPAELGALRLLPVLAPVGSFAEPVPAVAPPRLSYRPQVATAVRNIPDFLLQDREFTRGQAKALLAAMDGLPAGALARCVYHGDPLGVARMRPEHLLPAEALTAPASDAAALTGVDFYQAYSLARALGLVMAGDPSLFRLPLGCELELAAYASAQRAACHAAAAAGGSVDTTGFLHAGAAFAGGGGPTAAQLQALGDFVPTPFGAPFVGLDFGVREWVADLPHVLGAEVLLREWISDHEKHLERVLALADGTADPPPDPVGAIRQLGVVRGLACGEVGGLLDRAGARIDPLAHRALPATVPGVLRTEQLRRDGKDLLSGPREARLRHVGFRLAGSALQLSRLKESR